MEFGMVCLGDNLPDARTGKPISDAEKHTRFIKQAVTAEKNGFEVFHLGEHHFNYYAISAPFVALAALSQHTSTIKLGTGVTLLPTVDPIIVAEDAATLDAYSNGRAEVGVGRGIHEQIFKAMGRPATSATEIFNENLDLLHRLMTEENVHWQGKWRPPLDGVTIRPRAVQKPIPLWCGSTSVIPTAAKLGLPSMWVSVLFPFEKLKPLADQYRQAWVDAGRDEASFQLGIGVHYHIARTSQEARRRFEPYYFQYLEQARTLEKSNLDRAIAPMERDPKLLEVAPFCGSPQELVDRIGRARELLGLTRIMLSIDMGGMPQDVILEEIELTGQEVIPHINRAR